MMTGLLKFFFSPHNKLNSVTVGVEFTLTNQVLHGRLSRVMQSPTHWNLQGSLEQVVTLLSVYSPVGLRYLVAD